jgi:hypothetical protein
MAKWGHFAIRSQGPSLVSFIGTLMGDRVGVGDVVVIERPEQPGIFYVKRITDVRHETNQIFVTSDNPAGTDSRQWGWLPIQSIQAKVSARVRRAR